MFCLSWRALLREMVDALLRKVVEWTMRLVSWAWRLCRGLLYLLPPDVENCTAFRAETEWYSNEFTPEPHEEEKEYDHILDHAHKKYEETNTNFDGLDKKADTLFRLAAILAGILFSGVKVWKLPVSTWISSAFGCFLAAMVYAALARIPAEKRTPIKVRSLLLSSKNTNEMKAYLAASLHVAIEGTLITIRWKADKLIAITSVLCIAILLLWVAIF